MSGVAVPRRVLLDMHVPDWDPGLLASWDPAAYVDAAARSGATEVTIYAQSHLGLAYWPAAVGPVHAACRGRDWVAAAVDAARERGLATRGYYSLTQNNWAYRERPGWRTTGPLRVDGGYPGPRYGLVCFRNPGYRDFTRAQLEDLLGGRDFDSIFFDLTLFSPVCGCRHCATRFEDAGLGAPLTTVDWRDPRWWGQRALAEQDAVTWAGEVTELVHSRRPGLPVQHNFTALAGLAFGAPADAVRTVSHPAADFYGDLAEQLAVAQIFDALTARTGQAAPGEFMTSIALHVTDGVELKDTDQLEAAVALAVAANGAPTLIDAVRPDGTVNTAQYDELVAPAFARVAHARWRDDDEPVADVGVYYSDHGRTDEADDGRSAYEVTWGGHSYPHFLALKGAALALARDHVPFRVLTSSDLAGSPPRVLVVPSTAALGRAEHDALLAYAEAGGVLYLSGDTGRLLVDGELAVPVEAAGAAALVGLVPGGGAEGAGPAALDGVTAFTAPPPFYLRPVTGALAGVLGPADGIRVDGLAVPTTAGADGSLPDDVEVLAVVDRPVGDGVAGLFEPRGWVSVHHDPPVRRSVAPAVVRRPIGRGAVVYSAVPVEEGRRSSHHALFLALVRDAAGPLSLAVDAPPDIWVFARRDRAGRALTLRVVDIDDRPGRGPARVVIRVPGSWDATTAADAEIDVRRSSSPTTTELTIDRWRRFAELRLTAAEGAEP